ncbi:MAG: hypothetical protein M3285_04250, partial [Actinomycetota bacterium]|nr:hypothetical protein [Actinomycetota bacterium]
MKIKSIALMVALLAFVAGQYAAPRFAFATSPKRAVHRVKLGSTNVISGARTGFVTIRIPKKVVLSGDQGSNPDFNVSGGGLFGGFFLQKEDRKGLAILGGRLPSGGAFGPPGSKEILLPFFGDFASEYELEPGTYRLYLVADGPTKVTIRFDELKGARRLHVSHHTSIDAKMLPVRTAVQGQTNIYSAGGVSELKGYGLVLQYLSIKSDAWVAGEFGNCTYRGQPEE